MLAKTYAPGFAEYHCECDRVQDFYEGSKKVKDSGVRYLPPTPGQVFDGMDIGQPGRANYEAYKARAVFPDYVSEAVEIMLGLLHHKDATIELPAALEPLRKRCSPSGESLLSLLRRINFYQFMKGRAGLLVDLPDQAQVGTQVLPYMALYAGDTIINWDTRSFDGQSGELSFVVLDESRDIRSDRFNWTRMEQFRVLELDQSRVYRQWLQNDQGSTTEDFTDENAIRPVLRNRQLNELPFFLCNTKDREASLDRIPLTPLADICETIYHSEADYRHTLFLQGQDTLVVIGGPKGGDNPADPDAIRVGSGARIDVDIGGDAKYVGVSANGISEQRTAVENDRKRASIKSGQLIQSAGSQQESGDALTTRFTAQTATLNQIALTASDCLQAALKCIARWVGANEEEVKVTPNLEFVDFGLNGQDFEFLLKAKELGLPLSYASLHALMVDKGLTLMDFQNEIKMIQEEAALTTMLRIAAADTDRREQAKADAQKEAQKSAPTPTNANE